eukprot:TRINITY_DN14797_c0_g1_i1.p1 TRINITY_DN14797_c0_g1~~TRINITY_DN14797_c0_g1_i1.p1  ORF type:complete len:651 (+),score=222.84 TRINITY_DN14797_c0_g1_i1:240-1955(+)
MSEEEEEEPEEGDEETEKDAEDTLYNLYKPGQCVGTRIDPAEEGLRDTKILEKCSEGGKNCATCEGKTLADGKKIEDCSKVFYVAFVDCTQQPLGFIMADHIQDSDVDASKCEPKYEGDAKAQERAVAPVAGKSDAPGAGDLNDMYAKGMCVGTKVNDAEEGLRDTAILEKCSEGGKNCAKCAKGDSLADGKPITDCSKLFYVAFVDCVEQPFGFISESHIQVSLEDDAKCKPAFGEDAAAEDDVVFEKKGGEDADDEDDDDDASSDTPDIGDLDDVGNLDDLSPEDMIDNLDEGDCIEVDVQRGKADVPEEEKEPPRIAHILEKCDTNVKDGHCKDCKGAPLAGGAGKVENCKEVFYVAFIHCKDEPMGFVDASQILSEEPIDSAQCQPDYQGGDAAAAAAPAGGAAAGTQTEPADDMKGENDDEKDEADDELKLDTVDDDEDEDEKEDGLEGDDDFAEAGDVKDDAGDEEPEAPARRMRQAAEPEVSEAGAAAGAEAKVCCFCESSKGGFKFGGYTHTCPKPHWADKCKNPTPVPLDNPPKGMTQDEAQVEVTRMCKEQATALFMTLKQ